MRMAWSLKKLVPVGLVIVLPLAALPLAARWADVRLHGLPPAEAGEAPPLLDAVEEVVRPVVAERISPAAFDDPSLFADDHAPAVSGLDPHGLPPAPLPAFAPLAPSSTAEQPSSPEAAIDDQTLARLQQIRGRLEEMGADYVIVETTDGPQPYRFHCRMVVDPNSPFTRPFDATADDPLAAGEQVLREVEAWRMAAVGRLTRQR
jgi:hypothetical protein